MSDEETLKLIRFAVSDPGAFLPRERWPDTSGITEMEALKAERDEANARLRRFLDGDEPYCNQHDMERWERVEAENAAMKAVVEAAKRWRESTDPEAFTERDALERVDALLAAVDAFGARAGLNEGSER